MSLAEKLDHFTGEIAVATMNAPDDYPENLYSTYETNKAKALQLWSEIQPRLKRDLEKASFISQRLREGFEALDAGKKEAGRQAMWDIYNAHPDKLR
jgi:hypothetical protein